MPNPNLSFSGFCPIDARDSDFFVATVQSNNAAAIYPGEPVHAQSDGTVLRQAAGTNTADAGATDGITAVVIEVVQYLDPVMASLRRNAKLVPANTLWTADKDRTRVLCCLAREDLRFRCKANAAAASLAAARSLTWNTMDHVYGTANVGLGLSGIALNISTAGVSADRQWKVITSVIDVPQNDPTLIGFHLEVIPNNIYMFATQGVGL